MEVTKICSENWALTLTLRSGPRGAANGDPPATLGPARLSVTRCFPGTGGGHADRSTAVAVTESDSRRRFEVICEVEPPTRPDLTQVRHQIGVLSHVADSFLIPDNHIGRATVSSVAVAHEVQAMGARGIACLNSRDRNLLGFRRDLLTAAAYGVDSFLYVYGDKPSIGGRTSELTVQAMIEETRAVAEDPVFTGLAPFRAGVTCGLRAVPHLEGHGRFRIRAGQLLVGEPAAVARERAGVWAGLRRGNGAGQRGHGPEPGGDDPRYRDSRGLGHRS